MVKLCVIKGGVELESDAGMDCILHRCMSSLAPNSELVLLIHWLGNCKHVGSCIAGNFGEVFNLAIWRIW